MKINQLKNELRNLRFTHLTESELVTYFDQQLDQIGRARMEAHLKQCFICQRQFDLLREQNEALSNRKTTDEDVALVERLMKQVGLERQPSAARKTDIKKKNPVQEWLAEGLGKMIANWQIKFAVVLRGDQEDEVWRWQSEDGRLQAHAVMEENADMTVHISSDEMRLEGTHLNFRLGQLSEEIILQRTSESEVTAKVSVPWQYRRNMTDISIEIV